MRRLESGLITKDIDMGNYPKISDLIGKTLVSIEGEIGDGQMSFITKDGKKYAFFHEQDCCESVGIQDIVGNPADLLGEPLLEAEEVTSGEDPADYGPKEYRDESFTWTFYKFGTRKGHITVRWLGESNGYYSESVTFAEVF